MNQELKSLLRAETITEGDHLLELPGRVNVQEFKGEPSGIEGLLRQSDEYRGVLADGVE